MAYISGRRAAALMLGVSLAAGAAFAQSSEVETDDNDWLSGNEFSAEVSAGVEYDSNLSVSELDASSGTDDFAALLDIDLGVEREFGSGWTIDGGYAFSQSLHFDFSAFDIRSHRGSLGLARQFGRAEAGVDYNIISSTLDSDGFLTYQLITPYLSSYFGSNLFVRGAYNYADKNFIGRTDRDSTVHAGSLDAYFFFNERKTYLLAGYKYESEDAVDAQYDFNAHTLRARLTHRFPLLGAEAKGRVGWRYENRDYEAITPSIGEIRDDRRHRFEAEIEMPISDRLYTSLEYRYNNYSSNLPSVDYNESVAAVRIGARF